MGGPPSLAFKMFIRKTFSAKSTAAVAKAEVVIVLVRSPKALNAYVGASNYCHGGPKTHEHKPHVHKPHVLIRLLSLGQIIRVPHTTNEEAFYVSFLPCEAGINNTTTWLYSI